MLTLYKVKIITSMRRHPFLCALLTSSVIFAVGWQWGFQASTSTPFTSATTNHGVATAATTAAATVTVLLWHWPFGTPYDLTGDVCWRRYGVPRCRLVDRRSLYPTADVVVFHNRELWEGSQRLPGRELPRPPGQRWAWMSLESPENNGNLRPHAGVFNLTVSYRRDADVTIPYGELVSTSTEEEPGEGAEERGAAAAVNKSDVVCWAVRNYSPRHRRSQVYRELSAVVPVRVYGGWKGERLSPRALLPAISHCYFYLAFENSLSRDYITEKLWRNAYQGGAVPVVLGASPEDYGAVAPPGSFIHVDAFATVEDLGNHLKRLAAGGGDKKGGAYADYFAWKQNWKVKLYTDWRERLCRICSQYDTLPKRKVYADLEAWVKW